jgi:poly(A) polymerase
VNNLVKHKLSEKEWFLLKEIKKAVDLTQVEAYVVGGFVRDKILGRFVNDIDIVCVGDGIKLAKNFASIQDNDMPVSYFKNFGTAMVRFKDWELEFVGARKESYTLDSRKPMVSKGDLEDDQNRRDFTINAMAISLNDPGFGELIDPFGGLLDLEAKIIKTPLDPDITFSDDPLRMMRAIRFSNQLGFEIQNNVIQSICDQAYRLEIVSKERIMVEFNKILSCEKPSIGLNLLDKTGLLNFILPELVKMKGIEERNGIAHKDNFYHTLQVLDNICQTTDNLWLRWSALLHDIAKPPTKKFIPEEGWTFHGHEMLGAKMVYDIFKRLKLPLDQKMKFVQKLVKLHLRPMALAKEEVTDSAIRRLLFDAGEDVDDLMILCRADITSKNEKKIQKYLANYDLVADKIKEVESRDKIRNWQPPIDGQLIMDTFNIKPSKEVGIIKAAIREAILEGEIRNDFDQAFKLMVKIGSELGLTKVIA